jgi:hypothetical protein
MDTIINILIIVLSLFGFASIVGLSVIFALWYMGNRNE